MKGQAFSVRSIGVFVFVLACTVLTRGPLLAAQPVNGGVLRIATYTDGTAIGYPPESTHGPLFAMSQAFPAVETLFRLDKSGLPVPWLATGAREVRKRRP